MSTFTYLMWDKSPEILTELRKCKVWNDCFSVCETGKLFKRSKHIVSSYTDPIFWFGGKSTQDNAELLSRGISPVYGYYGYPIFDILKIIMKLTDEILLFHTGIGNEPVNILKNKRFAYLNDNEEDILILDIQKFYYREVFCARDRLYKIKG